MSVSEIALFNKFIISHQPVVVLFKEERFKAIFSIRLLELLSGIFINEYQNTDIYFLFEAYYDHKSMKIYFSELLSKLLSLPFQTKVKMFRLSEKYCIDIFVKGFDEYTKGVTSCSPELLDKIDRYYNYLSIIDDIDNGDTTSASSKIHKNHDERADYVTGIYKQAKEMWDIDSKSLH